MLGAQVAEELAAAVHETAADDRMHAASGARRAHGVNCAVLLQVSAPPRFGQVRPAVQPFAHVARHVVEPPGVRLQPPDRLRELLAIGPGELADAAALALVPAKAEPGIRARGCGVEPFARSGQPVNSLAACLRATHRQASVQAPDELLAIQVADVTRGELGVVLCGQLPRPGPRSHHRFPLRLRYLARADLVRLAERHSEAVRQLMTLALVNGQLARGNPDELNAEEVGDFLAALADLAQERRFASFGCVNGLGLDQPRRAGLARGLAAHMIVARLYAHGRLRNRRAGVGLGRIGLVEKLLDVCVAVAVAVFRAVFRVIGVEPEPLLPGVRHGVVIGVSGRLGRGVIRPSAHLVLRVNKAAGPAADLLHNAVVHNVANRARAARVLQHALVRGLGGLRGDRGRGHGFEKPLAPARVGSLAVDKGVNDPPFVLCAVVDPGPDVVADIYAYRPVLGPRIGRVEPEARHLHERISGLEIVANVIDHHVSDRMGEGAPAPIDHIVAQVEYARFLAPLALQQWVAMVVVRDEIVVGRDRGLAAAEDHAATVRPLGVNTVVQRLAGDAPLVGDVVAASVGLKVLVQAPTAGAVVYDHVMARPVIARDAVEPEAVAVLRHAAERTVARPHAQVPDDDIMGELYTYRAVLDADAVARCGLARDGDEGLADADGAGDDAGHAEHHDARPLGAARGLEAAGAVVVEIRHLDHAPAAAAGRVCAKSLGSRESWNGLAGRP